jgi:type IV secretory pathway ATPase VirB11/archaellum biosynthesis ATPase
MGYIIVMSGAPGSGKTTITRLLHQHFQSVMIELGWLRQYHLDPAWLKASLREETMSFENLVFILRNYLRYGYDHILVNDLEDHRVRQIPSLFASDQFIIISLVIRDDETLKRRVLDPDRDSGYRDHAAAIASNHALIKRPVLPNEHKLDNTNLDPQEASQRILQLIMAQQNKQ